MDFDRFLKEVSDRLKKKLGDGYILENTEMEGINGTTKHALLVKRQDSRIAPGINMDELYIQCGSEPDTEGAAESILKICREQPPVRTEDIPDFDSWDSVKSRIFGRLVNTEKNKGLLGKIPNRPFLDLSLIYYIRMEGQRGIPAPSRSAAAKYPSGAWMKMPFTSTHAAICGI